MTDRPTDQQTPDGQTGSGSLTSNKGEEGGKNHHWCIHIYGQSSQQPIKSSAKEKKH